MLPAKTFDQILFTTSQKFAPTFFLLNKIFYQFQLMKEEIKCSSKKLNNKNKPNLKIKHFPNSEKKEAYWEDWLKAAEEENANFSKNTLSLSANFWGPLFSYFFFFFLITGDSKIRQIRIRFKNRFQMSAQQVFHP